MASHSSNRKGHKAKLKNRKETKMQILRTLMTNRVCSEKVTVDHKGIECEMCKHWFHSVCEDIEDEEFEVLSRHTKGKIQALSNFSPTRGFDVLHIEKLLNSSFSINLLCLKDLAHFSYIYPTKNRL